jgi:hypothetical protein
MLTGFHGSSKASKEKTFTPQSRMLQIAFGQKIAAASTPGTAVW